MNLEKKMNRTELEQKIKDLVDEYLSSGTGITYKEYETMLDPEINTSNFNRIQIKLHKCEKTFKEIRKLLNTLGFSYSIDQAHYERLREITEIRNKFKHYK
jgi:hypothetical protein